MLIDEVLPVFEFSEFHATTVAAPTERVYAAIRSADLGGHPVVRALFALRGIPSLLMLRRGTSLKRGAASISLPITLDWILSKGFVLLGEDPGRELVVGITGQFWRPTGNLAHTDAARFSETPKPGMARAAWNFAVEAAGDGRTRLTTETRIQCGDAAALRSFRRYWRIVGPFSGLIRRVMLSRIARACAPPRH